MMQKLFTGILVLLLSASQLFACKCAEAEAVSKAVLERYDVVFIGKVAAVANDETEGRAQFSVISLYKGELFPSIELHYDNMSDCAMNFVPGETWIIYANWTDFQVAKAEMCGHSRRMPLKGEEDYYVTATRPAYAAEEKWLKDSVGIQPYAEPATNRDLGHKNEKPDPTQAIVYTLAGFLGLAVIFYIVKRMFRKDAR